MSARIKNACANYNPYAMDRNRQTKTPQAELVISPYLFCISFYLQRQALVRDSKRMDKIVCALPLLFAVYKNPNVHKFFVGGAQCAARTQRA